MFFNLNSFVKNKIDILYNSPLRGKTLSEYETNLRDLAYREALNALADGKKPNFEDIYESYKPTEKGLMEYYNERDNAYYGQLGIMNNIFEKRTFNKGDKEDKSSSFTYVVKKGVSAKDYMDYINTIKNNRNNGLYSDSEYKELYKPVAINEGYILKNLADSEVMTVEGLVARKLKELKGNQIGNVNTFSTDFWNCLAFVEAGGRERGESYRTWFRFGSMNDVNNLVEQWFSNSKKQAANTKII